MAVHPALDSALDLKRNTALAKSMRLQLLPEGMIDLIKCAGGCTETCTRLALAKQRSPEIIREAAINFLLLVAFAPEASAERQLGLNPHEAKRDAVRLHKRWLVRWLHPDHNNDPWQAVLLNRVLAASLQIESRGVVTAKGQRIPIVQLQSRRQLMLSRALGPGSTRSGSKRPSSHHSLYRMAQIPAIFVLIALFGYSVIAIGNYLDSLALLKTVTVHVPMRPSYERVGLRNRVAADPKQIYGARRQGDILLLHEHR